MRSLVTCECGRLVGVGCRDCDDCEGATCSCSRRVVSFSCMDCIASARRRPDGQEGCTPTGSPACVGPWPFCSHCGRPTAASIAAGKRRADREIASWGPL